MTGPTPTTLRVGLVLGGGGVQGSVWLDGALAALAAETGWSPAGAEVLIGTSAGSWAATQLAAGVPPWVMAAQSAGEVIDGIVPAAPPPPPARPRGLALLARTRFPGSPAMLRAAVRGPRSATAARQAMVGLVPRGVRDSGVEELVRALVPSGWPAHPGLRCVAVDYTTGRRVVLTGPGRGGTVVPHVAPAVAASCAVPGVFRPTVIGGREYVDGGVHSASNLDLTAGRGLDLVICLNPMSSLELGGRAGSVGAAAFRQVLRTVGRGLGREARQVREAGTPVLLLQPSAADLAVLGSNWLRPSRLAEVVASARETVARQVRESPLHPLLDRLPPAPPATLRPPPGPPGTWPPLRVPPALFT